MLALTLQEAQSTIKRWKKVSHFHTSYNVYSIIKIGNVSRKKTILSLTIATYLGLYQTFPFLTATRKTTTRTVIIRAHLLAQMKHHKHRRPNTDGTDENKFQHLSHLN